MKPSIPGLPRGGARRGAGRPKKPKQLAPPSPAEETPVAYALRIMRDETADVRRRDIMAKALLSYLKGSGKLPEGERSPDSEVGRDSWANVLKFKK
jgi:hypothetical protein